MEFRYARILTTYNAVGLMTAGPCNVAVKMVRSYTDTEIGLSKETGARTGACTSLVNPLPTFIKAASQGPPPYDNRSSDDLLLALVLPTRTIVLKDDEDQDDDALQALQEEWKSQQREERPRI